jgi:hypothetical protein
MSLSPLPATFQPWPVSVQNAYRQLYQIYQTAHSYVGSQSLEAHRLQQYEAAIVGEGYPLLLLMETSTRPDSPLRAWIEVAANEFAELLTLVDEMWMSAQDQ